MSFSQEVVLPFCTPKDKWQCHETFWLSQLIGDCYWLLTKARDAGNCPTMHRKATPPVPFTTPPQIVICPKMSVVLRFRKLPLEKMDLFSIPVRITPGNVKKWEGGVGFQVFNSLTVNSSKVATCCCKVCR